LGNLDLTALCGAFVFLNMTMRLNADGNPGADSAFQRLADLPEKTKAVLLSALLFVLVGATFFPVMGNGFVNFDDPLYVTENVHVKHGLTWENVKWAAGAVVDSNWHPLTLLSHMLDCQLFGLKPWGHHLTSVLLHATNTVLLFLLLKRMTAKPGRSFFVAALFGLHPLHVESVAWVAERKDVLSTLFGLLALLAYAKYAEGSRMPAGTGRPKAFFGLALVFFALGLMAKPMLVTLPCVLLLMDYWPLGRWNGETARKLIWEKWPFYALAAVECVVTLVVQGKSGTVIGWMALPFALRLENSLLAYVRYLGKFFYPADLCVYYPHPRSWPLGEILFAAVVLAVLSVLAIRLRRRQPWLLAGWLWFVGTLVPVIGLVQVGQQSMADRYTYFPLIGIFVLAAWGACELAGSRPAAFVLSTTASAIVVSCVVLTRAQIYWWSDSELLFRHAIAITENNALAHNNLGAAMETEGRFGEAVVEYRKALAVWPDNAPFHCNLGVALDRQGHPDEAISQFQEAIKDDPNYANAHDNLGRALNRKGRADEAVVEFQKTLRINPDVPDTHCNLGHSLDLLGRFDEAISQFQQALKLDPDLADAHANLGVTFGHKGLLDAAVRELQAAARLDPASEDIRYNLGNALVRNGQWDEAITQFQAALKLQPNDAATYNNLGTVLYRTKHLDEAIGEFQKALKLKPDYTEARQNLDTALRVKDAQSKPPSAPPVPGTGPQPP
jgi:protein O-mannosyl-transferase